MQVKLFRFIITWVMSSIIVVLLSSHIMAKTSASGIQSGIWEREKSPYVVVDDIIIPQGLSLTIEAGVIIKFTGPYRFIVAGAVQAEGTSHDRIVFCNRTTTSSSLMSLSSDQWYGIDFTDSSDDFLSVINYSIIRDCQYGIKCHNAYPLLKNIIMENVGAQYLAVNNSQIQIQVGKNTDYLSSSQRPFIQPLPDPPQDSEEQKQKMLLQMKLEAIKKAKADSTRIANKIKPLDSRCNIVVLNEEDIARLGFTSLPEIISFLPGCTDVTSYWDGAIATCRGNFPGQFNNRMLFLIDDMPIYDGVTSTSNFEFIPLSSVQQIEFYPGPQSSIWGKNAVNGVINIVLKKQSTPISLQTTSEIGSFRTKNISSYVGFNKAHVNIGVGNEYRDTNGHLRQVKYKEDLNFNSENDNYNLLIGAKLKDLEIIGSYFIQHKFQHGVVPLQKYSGFAEQQGFLLNTNFARKIHEKCESNIQLRFHYSIQQSNCGELGLNTEGYIPPNYIITGGNLYGADVKFRYLSTKIPATCGFSVEHSGLNHALTLCDNKKAIGLGDWFDTSISTNEISLFTHVGYNLTHFLGIEGGVRIHYAQSDENIIYSPAVRLVYNPFAPYCIQLSLRHGYRNPSLWENCAAYKVLIVPQRLEPEQNMTAECTFDYSIPNKMSIRLSGYQQDVRDVIVLHEDDNAQVNTINETDAVLENFSNSYLIYGCDAYTDAHVKDKWVLLANGMYCYVKTSNVSGSVLDSPKYVGNASVTYEVSSSVAATLNFQYIGAYTETPGTGSFYLVNTKMTLSLSSQISLAFVFNNVLGEKCSTTDWFWQNRAYVPSKYLRSFFILLKTSI